jgi:protein-tyrosine phosphatase
MKVIQREISDWGDGNRHSGELAVDIHCHCLPGVDDGPATRVESLELCRALVQDGIGTVIASPHQLGRYDGRNSGKSIRDAVDALGTALAERNIPLRLLPGAEVRIDERIPRLIRSGEVLTLADQSFLLLELIPENYIDPLPLIRWLAKEEIKVVIAHPERYRAATRNPDIVRMWVEHGAVLQVNAGSLLGEFGKDAELCAWALMSRPLPLVVATDAHDMKTRPPRLSRAAEQVRRRLGPEVAARACLDNPRKLAGLGESRLIAPTPRP